MNNMIPVSGFGFGLGCLSYMLNILVDKYILPLENHGTTVFINLNSL